MDKLPDPAEKQLRQLAADVVDLKVNAAFSALHILLADQYRLLIDKNLLTLDELNRRLATFEVMAAAMKGSSPETADQLLQATLMLRHAFGIEGSARRQ